jgi:hypothetical protein
MSEGDKMSKTESISKVIPGCQGTPSATKLKGIIVFQYIFPRTEDDVGVLHRPPNTYLG